MATLYTYGLTLQQIADVHQISRERVRQILRKHGVTSLGRRPGTGRTVMIEDVAREALRLAAAGVHMAEIGRRIGVEAGTVRKFLREQGVSVTKHRRGPSEETMRKAVSIGEAYLRGETTRSIAEAHGLQQPEIYRYLRWAGVPIRATAAT